MDVSNITKQAVMNYLKEGKRFDGRGQFDFRDLEITSPVSTKAEGSVRVKLGKTEVIAGVKMDVGEPYPDSLDKGNLVTSAELSPVSSENFESGPPTILAIELGRVTDRALRESGFINFEKLCVEEGKLVWNLFVDIYAINDDGNLQDIAIIAAIVALQNAKIPKIVDNKTQHGEWTKDSVPLTKKVPYTVTFHKIGDKIIVDPTAEEEEISSARVTFGVSLDEKEMINAMQKGKADVFTIEEMNSCIDEAVKKAKELKIKIEKSIK